jgi:hypothetical protein
MPYGEYACQGIFAEGNVRASPVSHRREIEVRLAPRPRLKLWKLPDNAALFISVTPSYRHARNSINVSVYWVLFEPRRLPVAIPASRNDLEEIRAALAFAAGRAADYVTLVRALPASPSRDAIAALERFHEVMPDAACDARDVMALLDEVGSPATVANTGGRYFGFVIGGSLPAVTAASWQARGTRMPRCA